MKKLKITWDEINKLLEETYNIKNISLQKQHNFEPDSSICEMPDYIEGEIK